MSISMFIFAAVVAAHGAATPLSVANEGEGYAQAQRALSGEDSVAPVLAAPGISFTPTSVGAGPAHDMAFNLTCLGSGTANKVTSATAWALETFSGFADGTYFNAPRRAQQPCLAPGNKASKIRSTSAFLLVMIAFACRRRPCGRERLTCTSIFPNRCTAGASSQAKSASSLVALGAEQRGECLHWRNEIARPSSD